jgi:hypothetical protein
MLASDLGAPWLGTIHFRHVDKAGLWCSTITTDHRLSELARAWLRHVALDAGVKGLPRHMPACMQHSDKQAGHVIEWGLGRLADRLTRCAGTGVGHWST